ARTTYAGHVVLVCTRLHAVVLDQAMGERGTAERVEARGDQGADRARVDREPVDRPHGHGEQFCLDLSGAPLEIAGQVMLIEVEQAPVDAGAGKYALS